MEPKKEEKGGFSVGGKKIDVGPSRGFDQGSAYDAMNSEQEGIGKTGSGNGGGKYEKNSETLDGRDYSAFNRDYEKGAEEPGNY